MKTPSPNSVDKLRFVKCVVRRAHGDIAVVFGTTERALEVDLLVPDGEVITFVFVRGSLPPLVVTRVEIATSTRRVKKNSMSGVTTIFI